MRGEDGASPGQLDGLGERHALGQVLPDPLDAEEAGMTLVGVEDLGLRVPGDRAVQPHRADAADAEQQFLAQPVIAAAAVQPVGDLAQQRVVILRYRSRAAATACGRPGRPRSGRDNSAPAGRPTCTTAAAPFSSRSRAIGRPGRIAGRVPLGLPALGRQRLGEIAMPVQQPDADQRHAEVAGRLQVIAGQDAKAARVLRQGRGDPVLGREVRDRGRPVVELA